jgi:hypothetical protein
MFASIPSSEKTFAPAMPLADKKTFPSFTRTEIEFLAFLVWIHVFLGTVARLLLS